MKLTYTPEELKTVLKEHKKWLESDGEEGSLADLCGADLRSADLSGADLRGADLRSADLRSADLRGADLDMATWPLWCGGTQTYLGRRLSLQLIYHLFNQHHQDPEIHATLEALRPLANEFRTQHRTDAPELRGTEMALAPEREEVVA